MKQEELFTELDQSVLDRIAELRDEQGVFFMEPDDEIQDIFYDICYSHFGPFWIQNSYAFEYELKHPETHLEYDERIDAWVSVESDDGNYMWGYAALEFSDGFVICTCRTEDAYDYATARRDAGW